VKKLLSIKVSALVIALSASASAHATVRVLDFDYDSNGNPIGNGQIIDSEYSDWGVNISSCNTNGSAAAGTDRINGVCGKDDYSGKQVAFDSMADNTADPDLEFNEVQEFNSKGKLVTRYRTEVGNNKFPRLGSYKSYYKELYSDPEKQSAWMRPGNVMILNEYGTGNNGGAQGFTDCNAETCANPDDEGTRPAGFFVFEFTRPVDILSLDFFDIELDGERNPLGPDKKVYFFFEDNTSASVNLPKLQGTGDGGYKRRKYNNMFNVTKLVVNLPGSGAINNLVYREVSAPATLGLFLSSLLFVAVRRRRS
jgi:hypothetical protein